MSWEPGHEFAPHTLPPLTREQLKAFAEASGDHNQIHLDDDYAKSLGFPSVIAHGMLSMAFLGDYLNIIRAEKSYTLGRFKVRFRKMAFPGDELSCRAKVKSSENQSIQLEISIVNQKGEVTTDGDATLLPG